MFRRKSYPDWAAVLAAFGLLLGAAAPWFALVLSIPPPAVQADAQVLTDEGGGPPSPQARSGDGQPKLIALTFDDGPSSFTDRLLDCLEENNAKATFFMVGTEIASFPEEVKRMKEEAQANAEADKKEKERIDKLNQADSMIFQTEKQLKDLGDKLPADKKAPIETALNKLKEAHKAQDIAGIDAAMAELNSVFQAASQEMYNAQNAQGGAQPGPDFGQQAGGNAGNNKQDGGVTDVDFEEVK